MAGFQFTDPLFADVESHDFELPGKKRRQGQADVSEANHRN